MTPNVSYHMAGGPRRPGDSCRSGHRMRRRAPTNARRGLQAGWLTPGDVTPTRVTLARPGLLECEKNVMAPPLEALAIKTAPSSGGQPDVGAAQPPLLGLSETADADQARPWSANPAAAICRHSGPMSQNIAQRAGSADDVKILKRIQGVRKKAIITLPH